MIITRTPLRISLAGGGTDMPAFFTREFGAVVSFTINKYIYVSVNKKFDGRIRLSYSKLEDVDSEDVDFLTHDIAREMLKETGTRGVEITSVSDIPGNGTGMGSSSAFAVGLGRALRADSTRDFYDFEVNKHIHADYAYRVERELCGHPVGKQDHYAAAFGGLNYFQFNEDGGVEITPFNLTQDSIRWIEENLILFYTGRSRSADIVLKDQEQNLGNNADALNSAQNLKQLAISLRNQLALGNASEIGGYLKYGWENKKKLSGGISMKFIDDGYDKAVAAGATGGKLMGAGGGGFMIFAVPPARQFDVETVLTGWPRVPFKMEFEGSRVIYRSQDE